MSCQVAFTLRACTRVAVEGGPIRCRTRAYNDARRVTAFCRLQYHGSTFTLPIADATRTHLDNSSVSSRLVASSRSMGTELKTQIQQHVAPVVSAGAAYHGARPPGGSHAAAVDSRRCASTRARARTHTHILTLSRTVSAMSSAETVSLLLPHPS